jgi:hypothetical protein
MSSIMTDYDTLIISGWSRIMINMRMEYSVAFFEKTLKDKPGALLEKLMKND